MTHKLNEPLIKITPENTQEFTVEDAYIKYPKEEVDAVVAKVNYKKEKLSLPKEEDDPDIPTLYVFRHGQSTDNEKMVFGGWRDSGLTKSGKDAALVLADLLKDKKIQMLISSDQRRSVDTMKHAMSKNKHALELEIHRERRIRERNYGDLQGQSKMEWKLKEPELTHTYRRSWDNPPPNGESIKMVVDRVEEFIKEIIPLMKQSNLNVAIACHGNSFRGFRKHFENLTEEETATVESPLAGDYAAYEIR
ncbi:hypothetical protein HN803_01445 [candidate division WWE3 bacterium]|jgi:2,3-bisphosphoglycerate-dependent phosphoglycerate mutase|nr:hypothetical protein [candidate division WWE3 bacterium]MBT7349434.1 hypothetical protein [candidate division WWE3 bacterium]